MSQNAIRETERSTAEPKGFKLITRIQDEVHRFAIEYHRLLGSKGQIHSILDDIEGIGADTEKGTDEIFQIYRGDPGGK